MTRLFQPILDDSRDIIKHRINSLFTPIQRVNGKFSDFAAYLLTPLADILVLDPIYTLNATINFINGLLSILRAILIWTSVQQQRFALLDGNTLAEFDEAIDHFSNGINDLAATILNPILSVLCLVTRPIASVVHAYIGEEPENQRLKTAY